VTLKSVFCPTHEPSLITTLGAQE